MLRAIKIRLYPNKTQEEYIENEDLKLQESQVKEEKDYKICK